MDQVPVVDISSPTSTSRRALDDACRDHGFFLLEGHGLDDLIDRTWRQTTTLFDADRTVRTSIERDAVNPLGWYDRELTKRRRDHKEVFDFIDPAEPTRDVFNRWPDRLPAFRETMAEFYEAFSALTLRTLDLLHTTLELSPTGRAAMVSDRTASAVRLNHYPVGDPVPDDERDGLAELGATALGYHTDPGTLTLLLQDGTGGLQAESRGDGWIDVPPRAGTVVVNLADAMQVWTNDRYCAAVHRVVPMTTERRFSIPYFSNPPRDAMIEPIVELCEAPARYQSFRWSDFMRARTDDNLTDAGVDDAQISDYSIA
ncbi:MAG: 2OG-Fe(II) oxygenase family protein [Acidimicrobiia bacterium]|nr:2OG-Fe(II) oxygenase family protein [Acidimicrobiia bacterium]